MRACATVGVELVQGAEAYVVAALEGVEEVAQHGVLDRQAKRVFFEILFRDVCLVERATH